MTGGAGSFLAVEDGLTAADIAIFQASLQFIQMSPLLCRIDIEQRQQFLGLRLHRHGIVCEDGLQDIRAEAGKALCAFERLNELRAYDGIRGTLECANQFRHLKGAGSF